MSNYTKSTNFASKDNLSSGNPAKIVKGTEIDTEFNNIATAIATKQDSSTAGDVTLTGTQTLTNKTIAFADNTLTGVAGTTATQTLTNKTLTSPVITGGTVDGESIGFRDIPLSGTEKTSSYSLTTSDIGKFVQVGSGGSITIPDATFAAGDAVSIFNNTSGSVTITCTITTAYKAGTDADQSSVTLQTRGVCTILFISGTVCVISGNLA
jgi:hypothetical protein